MSAGVSHHEIEIKLRVHDAAAVRQQIELAGFAVETGRLFEANFVLDTADNHLRQRGELIRLRQVGGEYVLTYKGISVPGPHKIREELEVRVDDGPILHEIFQRLGYEIKFRYEKYRTTFRRAGEPGVVTLDETPIGAFLELEGPSEWIDRTAAALGFTPEQYVLESYGALYHQYCREHGVPPTNMTF